MSINHEYQADSSTFLIGLDSQFTFNESSEFINTHEQVPDNARACNIDFSVVEYMDSSALGALLLVKSKLEEKGISNIRLVNCTPPIIQLLEVCQYQMMFEITQKG